MARGIDDQEVLGDGTDPQSLRMRSLPPPPPSARQADPALMAAYRSAAYGPLPPAPPPPEPSSVPPDPGLSDGVPPDLVAAAETGSSADEANPFRSKSRLRTWLKKLKRPSRELTIRITIAAVAGLVGWGIGARPWAAPGNVSSAKVSAAKAAARTPGKKPAARGKRPAAQQPKARRATTQAKARKAYTPTKSRTQRTQSKGKATQSQTRSKATTARPKGKSKQP